MLLGQVIHPPLLSALAAAGHGSGVLIADGNYPVSTARPEAAPIVYLNLQPGVLDAVTVLTAVHAVVPIEAAAVMVPAGPRPPIFAKFGSVLRGVPIDGLTREDFYAAARANNTALVIATGEIEHFGNILITIGTRPQEAES